MKFAVRTIKVEATTLRLASLLGINVQNCSCHRTIHDGIMLISVDDKNVCTYNTIRDLEVLLLNDAAAAALVDPNSAGENHAFKSLDGVDKREQYEHLSHLLHIQKATRNKR